MKFKSEFKNGLTKSSRPEVLGKKGVLENLAKFTGLRPEDFQDFQNV